MPRQKIPDEWKPCIRAIHSGSRGEITQKMLAEALGNHLGVSISQSRIKQICGFFEHRKDPVTGITKVQKIPTQRKGSSDE